MLDVTSQNIFLTASHGLSVMEYFGKEQLTTGNIYAQAMDANQLLSAAEMVPANQELTAKGSQQGSLQQIQTIKPITADQTRNL